MGVVLEVQNDCGFTDYNQASPLAIRTFDARLRGPARQDGDNAPANRGDCGFKALSNLTIRVVSTVGLEKTFGNRESYLVGVTLELSNRSY